jgi:hypothetical protein
MDRPELILLVATGIVLLLVIGGLMVVAARRRQAQQHSQALQQRFGPEYDRAVQMAGDPRQAEAELEARQKRVEALHIQPLLQEQREQFLARWRVVQAFFVDDPQRAIAEANQLVSKVMETMGYQLGDFETRVADLSVDHAHVIGEYRAARQIAQANEARQASTEDLRQAMVHYRALFAALLETKLEIPALPEKDAVP